MRQTAARRATVGLEQSSQTAAWEGVDTMTGLSGLLTVGRSTSIRRWPMLGRSRGQRLVAAMAAITVLFSSGCTLSGSAETSSRMRTSLLADVGAFAGFDRVSDWRHLDRPTPQLRRYFDGHNSTYRVIDADLDTAELAVWQTLPPGPEPFNANRIATGTGCVALHRQSRSVTSEVINCPSPLVGTQPRSTDTSWGRDSEAMHRAAVVIEGSIDQEVRWTMTRELDGTPRTTPRTLEHVVAAVQRAMPADGEGFALTDVRQHAGTVTGLVTAHASAVDPVDSRATVRAEACMLLTLDLDDLNPNFFFTAVTCVDP